MLSRFLLCLRHALSMWRVLSAPKNSGKGSWQHIDPHTLFLLAAAEMRELQEALRDHSLGRVPVRRVEEEAGDCSAFLAMIVDNLRRKA